MPGKASAPAAPLDFRAELWAAADTLGGHIDAAEDKHVTLGLLFMRYASDALDERRAEFLFMISNGSVALSQARYLPHWA